MRKDQTFGVELTQASDHLIDFTRIAERIISAKNWIPNYSRDEILQRLFIVISTVAAGFLGNQLMNRNVQLGVANQIVRAGAAGFAGFFISHLLVIVPLIKKRFEMKNECEALANLLREKVKDHAEIKAALEPVIQKILALTLVENGRAQASLTWGKRVRLMKALNAELNPVDLNNPEDLHLVKLYLEKIIHAKNELSEIISRGRKLLGKEKSVEKESVVVIP